MRNSLGFSRHMANCLNLLLASLLPFLMVISPLTRHLGILVCFYMSSIPCWTWALNHCNGTLGQMYFLCYTKKWIQRSRIVNTYQQFTRELNKHLEPPSNTVLPDVSMREIDVGIKCPLMHKNIVSGSYDHNGGVLTSSHGIKITIPKNAISKGDSVTLYTVVDLCGPFVFPLQSRTNLVSPYYWIGVTGSYHFQKPVQVEFEHYSVITDPSCFQLLSCKDDDESYTMQPVDYEFKLQGSSCTFQTYHFCSYCLHYCKLEGKKPTINKNRIGLFCLKPENYQLLSSFTVEILFSFTTSHCVKRLEELCKKKSMIIDTNCSELFNASCDKKSKNFFTLEYVDNICGWHVDHLRTKDLVIETKKINFYNDYTEKEELYGLEELSLFPPRFILNVKKVHKCTMDLYTTFTVTLYDDPKKRKILQTTTLNLSVPVSAYTKDFASISHDLYPLPTIGDHPCGINGNKCEQYDLIKYAVAVAPYWEEVAMYLGIPNEKISVINEDYSYVEKKCKEMFRIWLSRTELPCWCHFIQALRNARLDSVAGKVKEKHFCGSPNATASTEDSLKATNDKINLHDLLRYLNDIPNNNDLMYFVTRLLPKETAIELIRDIRRGGGSKEQNVRKICEAFLKEENPSWNRVHEALKETKCDDLADYVGAIYLPEM